MNTNLKALASLVLASAVAGHAHTAFAQTDTAKKTTKHHVRVHRGTKPTIQSEIEQLRQDMATQKGQIDTLQQQLSSRDAQLQQVQQQAQASVQQATQQAQDAVAAQQATNAQNTEAVATLKSAVTDLQANNTSLASTMQADQVKTTKAIEHPDEVHYKGITVSPNGSFIEFATVNRTKATGSDIPTPFSAIPYSASDAGRLSEFEATGRQSRLALRAVGKIGTTKLTAYYAMDWLGTGITSNNNQSNSYVVRERELWGQAAFHNGFTVTGGQQWSLATENAKAIENTTEVLPQNIDPNYNIGFVWLRQPGIRVTYTASPMLTVGISAEAAQTLNPSCTASTGGFCPVNYLFGQTGTGGGLYNSTANYSYNVAPDFLAKAALDTKMGHFELFGIERTFRNRVYPNENASTGKQVNTTLALGANAANHTYIGGGVGGSARLFAGADKKYDFGLKGQYGDGTSRYATTQLADTTLRPDGTFALLHNFSLLSFVDANVTPRLTLYGEYGTDYVGHAVYNDGTGTGQEGYGSHLLATSGCGTELAPGTGGVAPTNVGSCAVNTKDTREATAGYWYNFYKGSAGRFRQGFQYSWVERNTYTGLNSITPTAIDNVFETSMRYYLP